MSAREWNFRRDFVFDNIMEWYLPLRLRDEIHVTHTGEQSSRRHISIYIHFFSLFFFGACMWVSSVTRPLEKPFAMRWDKTINTLESACLREDRVHFYNNAPDDLPNRECMHFILSLAMVRSTCFPPNNIAHFSSLSRALTKHINLFHCGGFVASQCH